MEMSLWGSRASIQTCLFTADLRRFPSARWQPTFFNLQVTGPPRGTGPAPLESTEQSMK